MANEDVLKDFGKITCPTKWEDVTLKKYQDIERYYSNESGETQFNLMDVLHIMIDKDKDYIMALPSSVLELILAKLAFLQKSPEIKEPSNKITIDGEAYMVNFMEKLKTGEYIQTQTIMKSDPHNYAGIMAVLCRKEGEIYDSKYEAEVFESRQKMFEEVPVIDVLPVIHFFILRYMLSETPSQLSSKLKEAISYIRSNIESSQKSGLIGKLSTISAMRKLKKLEKTINSI